MTGYYIIAGVVFVVSSYVSSTLKRKFKYYSNLTLSNGLSGREIAEKMLTDHGIHNVKVISTPGQLTDHYNPKNKTVNLSDVVYHNKNAAAAAVAAHEVGHAVQHATAYRWLQMRSSIVPAVNISSKFSNILIMIGLGLSASGSVFGSNVFLLGIILFAATTFFTIITLPVEYDASNRALAWLKNKNIVSPKEYEGSKDALKWASRTYLVSALGSLATLLYFINTYLNRR